MCSFAISGRNRPRAASLRCRNWRRGQTSSSRSKRSLALIRQHRRARSASSRSHRIKISESRPFSALEHAVAGFLRAELPRKDLSIEKRGEVHDDGAFALGILVSSHLAIGGSEKRMRLHLDRPSGTTGEGAITALDRFGVAAKEKIRKA